ncbi:S8 family serine peptidase [Cryobacterium sp. PH31-AA6]|uniref:S8 family serine peptidase n=1 Tax=Cryobacterium sp. PH31-AA6 TaxID=3046205 RepID=UPI0024B92F3A|nr:S8 family serine peptidase [Cryobacterium sp. PH31-AA6]MDJ0323686.1 S8 family serine peptidase [Cryobacterium sp. PH31-AA6]
MRKTLAVTALVGLLVAGLAPAASARTGITSGTGRPTPGVQSVLASVPPGEMTTVVVTLRDQTDLKRVRGATRAARQKGAIQELTATANASQAPIRALLRVRATQGRVARITPFWVINGMSVTATADVIQELAARADVASITPDQVAVVPAVTVPEANIAQVSAPALWDLGFSGQGVVVASLDSGVDGSHPDLAGRWRGGTNSWYDPYGEHPLTPTDLSGHGTGTTGVIVGGDAGGTSIGMAPGAKWIAAKIFNDRGTATATAIHQAFQWALDPDHDPNTPDAPQIVNGSWSIGAGPGCDLSFQLDLQALRAAGILPVFAAGNYGSGGATSVSPANYPEALAVGAVNGSDVIYSSSSRGPSTCGGRTGIFPDLVAPGVNIRTTDGYGLYQTASGTSMSAPQVTGALALLMGAIPGLSVDQLQAALTGTAVDLGTSGPDTAYGNGRLNVLAAYQLLRGQQDFGVALTPTEASSVPGGSVTYTVQVTRAYGFGGDISLSLSGLGAAQAAWTFTPAVLPAGSNTSQLLVSPSSAIPLGGYPLTVTAGSGTISRTATATLTITAPNAGDLTGPATTNLTLTPSPTNGSADASLHATGDDTASGGSNIAAAEYFTDTVGADGTGTAMTVAAAAPTAGLYATIPAATVNTLADGSHAVSVHTRDAAGNWGPMATTSLLVDKSGPSVSAVTATLNPTLGATSVNLTAQATDGLTAVSRGEWFTGGDPGVGNATPMTVTGTGPWSLVSTPIDVSGWSDGAYSLTVRARDAAGNWSVNASTVLQVSGPLSFSTFGNSNPPGVGGTADDADIYDWSGTAFNRVADASAAPYGLPGNANVDGFDRVSPTQFYLSFSAANTTLPGLGAVQDEDVVFYDAGTWSVFFDGTARGLTAANQDLDAISVVGGTLFFSTVGNTNPPGVTGAADDADIYSWNGSAFARVWDASANGLAAGANLDGLVRVDATHFYLSFSADTTVPGLGAVQDEDVLYYNAGTWSVYFDGTAHGLGASGNLDVDAFDLP